MVVDSRNRRELETCAGCPIGNMRPVTRMSGGDEEESTSINKGYIGSYSLNSVVLSILENDLVADLGLKSPGATAVRS